MTITDENGLLTEMRHAVRLQRWKLWIEIATLAATLGLVVTLFALLAGRVL